MISRRSLIAALAAAACLNPLAAPAQGSGNTVRLLVGYPAGGSFDVVARALAEKLRPFLAQGVIVENRPGAGTLLAVRELKRARPDGQTLLVGTSGPFTIYPHIYSNLDYDPVKDFTPVARMLTFDMVIAVGPKIAAASIQQFVAWAKANPKQADFGTPGPGTLPHFIGIMLGKAIGVPFNHITYKGGAPALTDLLGGQIPIVIDTPLGFMEAHKAGKVRVVASSGLHRLSALPEVPTLKESGIDLVAQQTLGVYGPGNMRSDLVKRLNAAVVQAVKSPDIQARLAGYAMTPAPSTAQEAAAEQAELLKFWESPIKASGFRAD